ncbi:plastocyanin/azurin family copper-binding protein [Candidatus Nanosalina sp. VS9-1]|uniref:cupredoxin domain-containing protein n=1 Tax=Candidatus Nanosalina sp. VS9-1 TaxID=3388566 RepID=UPI0039DF6EF7
MEKPQIRTLALVVFAVSLVALFAPQQQEDLDESETYTVNMTERGFQPTVLTIEKGDTVVWRNKASISMWIASDPHPTHTDYSNTTIGEHCGNSSITAFDQCQTGEKYSFTFKKTGNWSYHNHRPFAAGGRITVTE